MLLIVLADVYLRFANGKMSVEMALEDKSVAENPPDIMSRSLRDAESNEDGFNNENMFEIVGQSVLDIVLRVDCASETMLDDIEDQSFDGMPHAKFFI